MGKVRKSRPHKNKQNLLTDNSETEEQIPVDSKENIIQTILDQLQAPDVEEKYCGLQTFAMLVESPENLQQIVNRDLIKVAAPLLLDSAGSVRNAAAGIIRNLSTLGAETCDILMDQDIMTPLTCYYHQYAETWTPDPNCKTYSEDIDTFIQCTNLLWNLCESSELAVKYLGQSKILDLLVRHLDFTFGTDIVIAVLQCLFVVIEDNPIAMEKIKSTSEKQLQQLLALEGSDPSLLLIKTLAAGVVISTCDGNIVNLQADVINLIISTLANSLSIDHRVVCNQLSSNVPLRDNNGKINSLEDKAAQILDKKLKSIAQMLDAQQSSVEIIANICSCEGSDDSINEGDSSDSEDMGEEDQYNNGVEILFAEDKLPPNILEALISLDIFEKVWARTQLPAENVMMILKEYDGSQLIYKKLHSLQTRALLCINNLLSSLPFENLGGVNGVYKIWVDAGKLVFKQNSDNLNLVESATAVMRAALDKIKLRDNISTGNNELFKDLALSDIEIMLNGIRECQMPEIRSNLIRMTGILALLLVNNLNDNTSRVICAITEFILEQAHKENEAWVLAEAIDTLVDLYSEDETDILAAKVKLVEKLIVLAPILKNKARQQKRLPKEYKVLVSTATSNLPRFIKYKKDRINKLK